MVCQIVVSQIQWEMLCQKNRFRVLLHQQAKEIISQRNHQTITHSHGKKGKYQTENMQMLKV